MLAYPYGIDFCIKHRIHIYRQLLSADNFNIALHHYGRDKNRALRNYLESVTSKLISARLINSLCLDTVFGCLASVLNCSHTLSRTTLSKGGLLLYRRFKILSRPVVIYFFEVLLFEHKIHFIELYLIILNFYGRLMLDYILRCNDGCLL